MDISSILASCRTIYPIKLCNFDCHWKDKLHASLYAFRQDSQQKFNSITQLKDVPAILFGSINIFIVI